MIASDEGPEWVRGFIGSINMSTFISVFESIFAFYALSMLLVYMLLVVTAILSSTRSSRSSCKNEVSVKSSCLTIPISIVSPAYNEERTVVRSVLSLLDISYDSYEVIVINDGSTDATMEKLIASFSLVQADNAPLSMIDTQEVRAVYASMKYPNLTVVDKENGGKADALNSGLNIARHPFFCAVDADSVLSQDALTRICRPFYSDDRVVAVGGTVRILNGLSYHGNTVTSYDAPRSLLALFQVIEYARSFAYGRSGWKATNGLLLISGAFGVFRKDSVLAVGGYRCATIGEDMELVLRLHRELSGRGTPYLIDHVSDAVCYTEAPEDLVSLRNQRIRWQRGLGESLVANSSFIFSKHAWVASWIAYPFFFIYELLGPVVELLGIFSLTILYIYGLVDRHIFNLIIFSMVGMSLAVSAIAVALSQRESPLVDNFRGKFVLFMAMIPEALIFRQAVNSWRTIGLFQWLAGKTSSWGHIVRIGDVSKT